MVEDVPRFLATAWHGQTQCLARPLVSAQFAAEFAQHEHLTYILWLITKPVVDHGRAAENGSGPKTAPLPLPSLMEWKDKARRRCQELANQIPDEWKIPAPPPSNDEANMMDLLEEVNIFEELDLQITRCSAVQILSNIQNRKWTCESVMLAFCKRATIAHQLVNCVTNFLFNEALQTARRHDTYFRDTGRLRGPLHGLPISVKASP